MNLSQHLRKRTKEATLLLGQNHILGCDGLIKPKLEGYHPTAEEWSAIEFMCDQWEFECHITKEALQ